MKHRLLFVVAVLLSVTSTLAAELPTEHTIGRIEAVFEFRGAMPTGVSVAPNGRIFVNNDVRFDLRQGTEGVAYITDSATGVLIVVDLASGTARRRLVNHYSTKADPSFVPIVEGETLMIRPPNGPPQPFAVPANGIALSADGTTLYYCSLSSRHLFSVPTALLRDGSLPDSKVGAAVVDMGEKGASDGLEADAQGRILCQRLRTRRNPPPPA